MLEIPESAFLAKQLNNTVRGKIIKSVVANSYPHKFAFFNGEPEEYGDLLKGKTIGCSTGLGAMLEISAENRRIVLGDGAMVRYFSDVESAPQKHQLLINFEDQSALSVSIQMYGSVYAFLEGGFINKYYLAAKEKPDPLTEDFDRKYFDSLFRGGWEKLSAKAFLATEQRIPGLGNGVLQDILFRSGLNPKRKMVTLSESELDKLFFSLKNTLKDMAEGGGRDTEKDLFGRTGGYKTILSKNTLDKPCPVCGSEIQKASYMGGAVYWCPSCQPL